MNSVDGEAVEVLEESSHEGLEAAINVDTAKVGSGLNVLEGATAE